MAHFLIYKRPTEVTPYTVDFSELLSDSDTQLDTSKSNVKAIDSAGDDQSGWIQNVAFDVKKMTATFNGGLDGEDYLVFYNGVGDVSAPNQYSRVLEIRVRSKISGNL